MLVRWKLEVTVVCADQNQGISPSRIFVAGLGNAVGFARISIGSIQSNAGQSYYVPGKWKIHPEPVATQFWEEPITQVFVAISGSPSQSHSLMGIVRLGAPRDKVRIKGRALC